MILQCDIQLLWVLRSIKVTTRVQQKVWYKIYNRISAVVKVETDIVTGIAASPKDELSY